MSREVLLAAAGRRRDAVVRAAEAEHARDVAMIEDRYPAAAPGSATRARADANGERAQPPGGAPGLDGRDRQESRALESEPGAPGPGRHVIKPLYLGVKARVIAALRGAPEPVLCGRIARELSLPPGQVSYVLLHDDDFARIGAGRGTRWSLRDA